MTTRPLLQPRAGARTESPCSGCEGLNPHGCNHSSRAFHETWISYDAIVLMLNAEDESERDSLTRNWRDHKIQELRFVGTVGALLAGCLASTGSWPDILPGSIEKPWSVRVIWHSGLIFALFAVLVSCQQSMRLHRLSAHRNGLNQIRACVGKRHGHDGKRPSGLQMYAWEASLLFLTAGVICAVAGLTLLVWLGAIYGVHKGSADDEAVRGGIKMAATFTVALMCSVAVFLVSQAAMAGVNECRAAASS